MDAPKAAAWSAPSAILATGNGLWVPKDLGQDYQGCCLLLGAPWAAAGTDTGTGGALEQCWQLHSPCGDVPGLGDISPPSWSATLVSMQDMLPKAQVVWDVINKFVGLVGRSVLEFICVDGLYAAARMDLVCFMSKTLCLAALSPYSKEKNIWIFYHAQDQEHREARSDLREGSRLLDSVFEMKSCHLWAGTIQPNILIDITDLSPWPFSHFTAVLDASKNKK